MGDIAPDASRLSTSFRKLWAVQILEKATARPQGDDYEGENEQAYHESPRPAQPRRSRIRGEGGYYEGNSRPQKSTFARKRAPIGLWMMAAQRCVPSVGAVQYHSLNQFLWKGFKGCIGPLLILPHPHALLCWTAPVRYSYSHRMIGVLIIGLIVAALWAGSRVIRSLDIP